MNSPLASPTPDWQAPAKSGAEVQFSFLNTPAEFALLVPKVDEYLETNAIGGKDQYVVQLCLEESIINIINHGYPSRNPDVIKLTISVSPEFIKVILLDNGIRFNPLDQPESNVQLSVEERSIGGLGIHLMKHYLQDMNYQRIGDANQLSFLRKREPDPASG